MLDDYGRRKSEFLVLSEEAAVKDLLRELETTTEQAAEEKKIAEAELFQVTAAFESKLLQIQEREAAKDFELSKLQKELELARAEAKAWLERNQLFQQAQQKEIERLRKFINDRQTEISTQRAKVGNQLKRMKEIIKEKDQEVRDVKSDKFTRYLRQQQLSSDKP